MPVLKGLSNMKSVLPGTSGPSKRQMGCVQARSLAIAIAPASTIGVHGSVTHSVV